MNKNVTVKTNHVPRNILSWYDLSEKEKKEFDYLDTKERQQDATFFRYRGWTYDLGEFMRLEGAAETNCQFKELAAWTGYSSDSYFSGVVFKWVNDYEQVIVGTYFS